MRRRVPPLTPLVNFQPPRLHARDHRRYDFGGAAFTDENDVLTGLKKDSGRVRFARERIRSRIAGPVTSVARNIHPFGMSETSVIAVSSNSISAQIVTLRRLWSIFKQSIDQRLCIAYLLVFHCVANEQLIFEFKRRYRLSWRDRLRSAPLVDVDGISIGNRSGCTFRHFAFFTRIDTEWRRIS